MMPKKPYNISSKPTKTRRSTTRNKDKVDDATTRIRIDKSRLNDTSSLDTSFLEGRVDSKSKKKVLNSKPNNKKSYDFTIIRNIFLTLLVIALLVVLVLFLMSNIKTEEKNIKNNNKDNKTKVVEKIDDNYLFVGDYHTNNLNFEDLDYHYNKISDDNYELEYLLENMNNEIYRYNPSIVFIELGINDLNKGVEEVDIVTNLSEVIDGIKKNRPYAEIYIESIYPINDEIEGFDKELINENINNEKIKSLNTMIKDLSKDKKVEYLDIYKELIKDGNLNGKYTDNGVYLNEEGYGKVLNLLRKVVDKNEYKSN